MVNFILLSWFAGAIAKICATCKHQTIFRITRMAKRIEFLLSFTSISLICAENILATSEVTSTTEKDTLLFPRNPAALHLLSEKDRQIFESVSNLSELVSARAEDFPSVAEFNHVAESLTSYLQDYDESTTKLLTEYKSNYARNSSYRVGWNPLASFRMLYRLVYDYPVLIGALENSTDFVREKRDEILGVWDKWPFHRPTETDLMQAIGQLIQIQTLYRLRSEDIAEGILLSRDTKVKLGSAHCSFLGNFAFGAKSYSLAVSWALAALNVAEKSGNLLSIEFAEDELAAFIVEHDQNWVEDSEEFFTRLIGDELTDLVHQADVHFENSRTRKNSSGLPNSNYIFGNICLGNSFQTEKERSELFCWYERKSSPYLIINAVKAELLSKDPLIVRYYEVITTTQIRVIQRNTVPGLRKSEVYKDGTGILEDTTRSSMDAIFLEDHFNKTKNLPKFLSSITGLDLRIEQDSAEMLQVVVYAFGALYNMHLDALDIDPRTEGGDRIATMVLYLSDVELGGGTAFLHPGIVAQPVRGSMVFWYNLESSGSIDYRTLHGGCPIVLGEKWIANKWVRVNSQLRTHPCRKGKSEFQFYANGVMLQ